MLLACTHRRGILSTSAVAARWSVLAMGQSRHVHDRRLPIVERYVLWLAVQSLMERSVVLGMGVHQESTSPALAELLSQYASILASQVACPDAGQRACHP